MIEAIIYFSSFVAGVATGIILMARKYDRDWTVRFVEHEEIWLSPQSYKSVFTRSRKLGKIVRRSGKIEQEREYTLWEN